MVNNHLNKQFDLEERTLNFSKAVLNIARIVSKNETNIILLAQVIRSGTSIGANYREANEALGKKDFFMRIRISRKEAKETVYWLELILHNNPQMVDELQPLIKEATELLKIFSAIILKA
jgi:four helix bundle protein